MRIASLPWYDLPTTHGALDAFWLVLHEESSRHGIARLPDRLDRDTPLDVQWSSPELLVSQCCGLDLLTAAGRMLAPIARPVFSDLDVAPGNYFSHIVMATSLQAIPNRIAINSRSSRSGCAALLEWMSTRGWRHKEILLSGSHANSLTLLRNGEADIAAIDAHSWTRLDQRGVRIVGRSASAPSPPFVCHRSRLADALAIRGALECAVSRAGDLIGVRGIIPTHARIYRASDALDLLSGDLRSDRIETARRDPR
jgi:DNA-binding transcriptional LysR family regulator